MLAHELDHRSRGRLDAQVAAEVFHAAKPAMKVYTLRKQKETFDWINELTLTLIQVWALHLYFEIIPISKDPVLHCVALSNVKSSYLNF